jgi:hypothetical protein
MAQSPLSVAPHVDRAVALAGLGRIAEARAESARAVALFSQGGLITGSRTVTGLAVEWTHLRLLLQAGDRTQALARIRKQLEGPGLLSPDWIQSDPAFAAVLALPEYRAMKQEFYGRMSHSVLRHGPDPKSVTCPAT